MIGNSSSVCNMGKWNNALPQCKGRLWFWEHYPKQKMHINTLLHVLFGSIRNELKKVQISYFALDLSLTVKVYKARMESKEQVAELGANIGVVGLFLDLLNLKLGLD